MTKKKKRFSVTHKPTDQTHKDSGEKMSHHHPESPDIPSVTLSARGPLTQYPFPLHAHQHMPYNIYFLKHSQFNKNEMHKHEATKPSLCNRPDNQLC